MEDPDAAAAAEAPRRVSDSPASDREREIENLRAVYRSLHEPAASAARGEPAHHPAHKGNAGKRTAAGGIVAALAFLAGKLKLLGVLGAVLKFKTLATMALSVGLYATQWGWPFALGFVLLIFVHELGHAIVLHHEGIPAGAPVFIPFVGAVIAMRGQPRDAGVEAVVAIGGPLLGSIGAWGTLAAGMFLHQPLLAALGHVGVMLNLFNLIPVPPLDGGRIAGAFSKPFWIVGYSLGVVALVLTRSPILFLALLLGLWTLVQRWRHPVPGYDRIGRVRRLTIALGYFGLAAALIATLPLGAALAQRAHLGG
jgi:Zn-dependent protease